MSEDAYLPDKTSSWSAGKSLTPTDFSVIDNMVVLLEPFFRYTELMSANKLTAAQPIILIKSLQFELNDLPEAYVYKMKTHLQRELKKRFFSNEPKEACGRSGGVEYNITEDPRFAVPTLLHPMFRIKAFKSKDARKKAKDALTTQLTELAKFDEQKRKKEQEQIEKQVEVERKKAAEERRKQPTPAKKKKKSMLAYLSQDDEEDSGKKNSKCKLD